MADDRAGPGLHVAAAVIRGEGGRVLLSRRPDHVPHGGLWEFPGGKLEAGEDVDAALFRELHEELGIRVERAVPLIRVRHRYRSGPVLLDVREVTAYAGRPHGREGQLVRWVDVDELPQYRFPEANLPIVTAARLPERYLITPEPAEWASFLRQLERRLEEGIRLVQLRAKRLDPTDYAALAEQALRLVRDHGARLLLNSDPVMLDRVPADGIHLSGARLAATTVRPVPAGKWLAASCHNAAELKHARQAGADFAVLSPVRPTTSHPHAQTMGWDRFAELASLEPFPVYALGGMTPADMAAARAHGGRGIAAITALWEGK